MLGGRALLLAADPPPLILSDPAAEPAPLTLALGGADPPALARGPGGAAPPPLPLWGFEPHGGALLLSPFDAKAGTSTPLLLWRPKA
jgi:hypothetical protein